MAVEAILDLADKAARCVLHGRPIYTPEDWQDATQEAAMAIYAEWRAHPARGEGYLFLVAKSAIYDWLRVWLRHPRGCSLFEYVDHAVNDAQPVRAVDGSIYDALAPLLAAQRAAKIADDVRYLQLRIQGYSTDGIALEMGLTRRNVYAIRERLLPRLARIAAGETVPTRGEAIRAAKAQKRMAR